MLHIIFLTDHFEVCCCKGNLAKILYSLYIFNPHF